MLGHEQAENGNPLAGYLELLGLADACHAAGQSRFFFDVKANRQAQLGDILGALRSYAEISRPKRAEGPLLESPLDDFEPVDAIEFLVGRAETQHVIMIGEEHVQPQTRTILKPLLERLWQKGFRYLAAETLSRDLSATITRGYAINGTGTYTREPVFAEAVGVALRLGYELVPYENTEPPPDLDPKDRMERQNFREAQQARNLVARIFAKEPLAKVLVWAGRAHVSEFAAEVPGGGKLEPMAYVFRELSGIDPFTVYLPCGAEQAAPEYEFPFYRYATHRGLVTRPTVFARPDGECFGVGGDATVFFPRTRMVRGRPDWLESQLGREAVEIPRGLLCEKGYQLAQAFAVEDFEQAVPVDQVLIAPGDPVPVLMLPSARPCWVRCIDQGGTIHGPVKLEDG